MNAINGLSNPFKSMDLRVQTIIEIVLQGLLRQFESPKDITELPEEHKTRKGRARGLQTAIEDLFHENGDSFNGFSLVEGALHHKLEHFASVTGKYGPRGFDVTLRDDLTGGIVLIELKWTTTRNAPALIYEQSSDALKLALALSQYGVNPTLQLPAGEAPVVRGYIICGAYDSAWDQTSVRDVFGLASPINAPGSPISTVELWHRSIKLGEPDFRAERNRGKTVGCDLHRGSKTARFKLAPDLLVTGREEVQTQFRAAPEAWFTRIAAIEAARHDLSDWVKPLPHHVGDPGVKSGVCGDPLCAVSW